MVLFDERYDKMKVEQRINLGVIKEFTIKYPQYNMIYKYVNKQNLCYAVLLDVGDEKLYIPVDYSVHISDNIPIHFDPFDRQKIVLDYGILRTSWR